MTTRPQDSPCAHTSPQAYFTHIQYWNRAYVSRKVPTTGNEPRVRDAPRPSCGCRDMCCAHTRLHFSSGYTLQLSSKPAPDRMEQRSFSRRTFLFLKLGSFNKLRRWAQGGKRLSCAHLARAGSNVVSLEASGRRRQPLGLLAAKAQEGERAWELGSVRAHTLDSERRLHMGEA